MIRINLLPIRKQQKQERSKHFVITYLLSILLGLSGIGYVWNTQSREHEKLNKRHAILSGELSRYNQYDEMLKKLKKEKGVIDEKRRIIKDLRRDRDRMARALALFSIYIPAEKMWFDKFSNSNGRIKISGVALSNEAIAEFLRNLETSPYIARGSVNLSHSRQKAMGKQKLREFQISCTVLPYSKVKENQTPQKAPARKPETKA